MNKLHPYQTLLAIIGNVFDAHAALLFMPEAENREQGRLLASWCPNLVLSDNSLHDSKDGYVGWVMRNASPLLVDGAELLLSNINYYSDEKPQIKSFLASPIAGGGLVVIDSLEENAFDEDTQKMLALFARLFPQIQSVNAMTSLSLEISTYYYALEALSLLNEHYSSWRKYLKDSLKIISEASGFEYVAFASRPEESEVYLVECENVPLVLEDEKAVEFSVQAGMVGWVLRNDESIFNDGFSQAATPLYGKVKNLPEFISNVTIAIKIDKITFATLSFASRTPTAITPELKSFVKMVSANIAHVLEKVYLKHKIYSMLKKAN